MVFLGLLVSQYYIPWIVGSIIVGFVGTNRKGGYFRAFLVSLLLSPVVGLFITIGSGQKNPKGCKHCGNKYNEAIFCGMCGKNEKGENEKYLNNEI